MYIACKSDSEKKTPILSYALANNVLKKFTVSHLQWVYSESFTVSRLQWVIYYFDLKT